MFYSLRLLGLELESGVLPDRGAGSGRNLNEKKTQLQKIYIKYIGAYIKGCLLVVASILQKTGEITRIFQVWCRIFAKQLFMLSVKYLKSWRSCLILGKIILKRFKTLGKFR